MSAARHAQTDSHSVQTAIYFVLSMIGLAALGLYQLGLVDDTVETITQNPGAVAFIAVLVVLATLAVRYAVHPHSGRARF